MYSSTNEKLIIVYNEIQNKFIIQDYYRKTQKAEKGNRDSVINATKHFSGFKGKSVPRNIIDSLLAALTSEYERPTFDDLGLNIKDFQSYTSPAAIKKVARKYDYAWKFNLAYTTVESNQNIFNSIQNPDTFNLYLTIGLDTIQTWITDYWNFNSIIAISGTRKYAYSGQYPNIYRQPWSVSLVGHNHFVNLKINRFVIQLIPKRFYNRRELELTRLTDDYIKWYLKRIGFGINDFMEL